MKKTLLILAVFTFFTSAFSQIPNYVPQNGLVGWWPFNGNANDESGNGNNGTVNGATLTEDRNGAVDSAYQFNGLGDYIEFNNINVDSISGGINVVSFWCKWNGGNLEIPFSWDTSYTLYFSQGQFGFNTNQSNTIGVSSLNFLSQWKHVVAEFYNGVPDISNCKLWIDGIIQNLNGIASLSVSATSTTIVGAAFNLTSGNNYYFNGTIDDIGVWNRALTECEIQDLYHAQLNSVSLSISAGADQSICAGDNVTLSGTGGSNYQWDNNVVDGQAFAPAQSNAYVLTAQDTLGCTGIDTVVVTVLENSASTFTETALDSYTLNGQTYTQSGTYTQTLTAANGCDSTITLNLTLNFTGIDELGTNAKKLVKISDLNGKTIPRRKNTLMLFIYEDGTVERVVEMEE